MSIERYLFLLGRRPAIDSGDVLYYCCIFCDAGCFRVHKGEAVALCQSCHWEGTVVDLIADFEQISKPEAGDVAEKATMKAVSIEKRGVEVASPLQQKILTQMTAWWHGALFWQTKEAAAAREYLLARGVSNTTQLKSVYGYSPYDPTRKLAAQLCDAIFFKYGWHGLTEAKALGIFNQEKGSPLVFRLVNRVVFSSLDQQDRSTLYYRARVIEPSLSRYKYLTSPGIKYASFWEPD